MVMDHSLMGENQQEIFHKCHTSDKIVHVIVFVTPVVDHWPEREIAQWVH